MEENNSIDLLIQQGAIEICGIDSKTGETMYRITDKMKKVNPDLYRMHQDETHRDTMYLWENGFLDIDVTEINPVVRLLPKAFDESAIMKLPKEQRFVLEDIVSILMKENM